MTRPALPEELVSIAELYHATWHETQAAFMPEQERCRRTLSFFSDRMRPLVPTTLVGYRDGRLAGFVCWHGDYLGQLFVRAQHRGLGLANELLNCAERAMVAAGTDAAELHCVVGNERAFRFYKRNGWHSDGMIAGSLADSEGDVSVPFWRMTKQLR